MKNYEGGIDIGDNVKMCAVCVLIAERRRYSNIVRHLGLLDGLQEKRVN
jgi:hypothetical protein